MFEDVVFALESAKSMKIQVDKSGKKVIAKKPEARKEARSEENVGKLALFFQDI